MVPHISIETNHDNVIIQRPHQPPQQLQPSLPPVAPPTPANQPSSTIMADTPHSSPTPSTSGTWTDLSASSNKYSTPPTSPVNPTPLASGSTNHSQYQNQIPGPSSGRILYNTKPVCYWELHLGKELHLEKVQFLKRCWSSIRKSVNKDRKLTDISACLLEFIILIFSISHTVRAAPSPEFVNIQNHHTLLWGAKPVFTWDFNELVKNAAPNLSNFNKALQFIFLKLEQECDLTSTHSQPGKQNLLFLN